MPASILEKPEYFFISYEREVLDDFSRFRILIEESLADRQCRDIIVILPGDRIIAEEEVLIVANALKQLQGTERRLNIIANPATREKLARMNLFKAGNGAVYGDLYSYLRTHFRDYRNEPNLLN